MNAYEAQRQENIERNKLLITSLGIKRGSGPSKQSPQPGRPAKKPRIVSEKATRVSARIAAAPSKPSYSSSPEPPQTTTSRESAQTQRSRRTSSKQPRSSETQVTQTLAPVSSVEVSLFERQWSSWTPTARLPERESFTGVYRFDSHPDFTPNKSPEEMLREGCFGGSYFRPLYSRQLGITITDDWKELPSSWKAGLNVVRNLTNPDYDADVNKFKVSCGQNIEQWEVNGWINHKYDVRGWFQWYCRFFIGRRCEDDDRQVSRWKKCVGKTGRWRRMLLKKYVSMGVREVWDDGEDEHRGEVSPVMHQTCHHWAYEAKQTALDDFWNQGE